MNTVYMFTPSFDSPMGVSHASVMHWGVQEDSFEMLFQKHTGFKRIPCPWLRGGVPRS